MLLDLAFLVVTLLTATVVARGGAVRAGVYLIVVAFAGLLAMNWFELLATGLAGRLGSESAIVGYLDFASLVLLFAAGLFVMRFAINGVLPESGDLPKGVEAVSCWGLSLIAGYVTAAFLAAAVHTYPGSRDFGGYFPPEPERRSGYILKTIAPDYRWLGFTQHTSAGVFAYGDDERVFDGPQLTAGQHTGSWPTFPIRYAKWRASLTGKKK